MPTYPNSQLIDILGSIDLGSSIAEKDTLLEVARIENSTFLDFWEDRIDIVLGTKGSGKSAIYRVFTDFLARDLRDEHRIVLAHSSDVQSELIFQQIRPFFAQFDETDFVNFWCAFFTVLARDKFVRSPEFKAITGKHKKRVAAFEQACDDANIPDSTKKSGGLRDAIMFCIRVVASMRPAYKADPDGSGAFTFTSDVELLKLLSNSKGSDPRMPEYVRTISTTLTELLEEADYTIWMMLDRLDELFERRSKVETVAIRGLLRSIKSIETGRMKLKLFLRDDIYNQITSGGFTALSHINARSSKPLQWNEEQLLHLIIKRLYSSPVLRAVTAVRPAHFALGQQPCESAFYKFFPETVNRAGKQSKTLRWIYNHCMDGKGVVTPRDVLELLRIAIDYQIDECNRYQAQSQDSMVTGKSLKHALEVLSHRKVTTYLKAEFPELWKHISKFHSGKTEYTMAALKSIIEGANADDVIEKMVDVGFLRKIKSRPVGHTFQVPFLFRAGLELSQGKSDGNDFADGEY
jgi:hypothetical protein